MDREWSPWRYQYVTGVKKETGCVFCRLASEFIDQTNFILHRGTNCYIVLNIYPYMSGHLLIIPFAHLSLLSELPKEASDEVMDLTKQCQFVLEKEYKPQGFNLGMNLGQAAGAGVAAHLHMHIFPRWFGDINFTTTVGETRILPEMLENTYQRLKPYFS
ncbi:MAG: diadenosine tetraphosphate (Ap4A) hydrolase-like HIT family hydrolase [bacterium]|nr:MAG: diadenosine tetraphosphate (Ap4A) hydrolase-like HIT family hydrolase [bacterium]